jgi:hypothetical protein
MPKTKPAVAVDNDNPFIFTPMRFQKSHYTPPVVAKGDLVTFKAYLANPFAFQVTHCATLTAQICHLNHRRHHLNRGH